MTNQKIGEILYTLRMQRGLGQEKLCRGLCSKAALSRYELGERTPDRLLLNALMQRLGKSADKMATILFMEEYEYLLWKKKVLLAVGQEDMRKLERFLKEPAALKIKVNEILQQQFYCQMQAILADKAEQDLDKSIALQKEAVELTLPGLSFDRMDEYLISIEEMQLLLSLAEQMKRGNQKEEACRLLLAITDYSQVHYSDKEAQVKIYPKAVKLAAPLLMEQKRYLECMLLAQKAIDLLRWQGVLYDLAALIEVYLQCCREGVSGEQEKRYEKQLEALKAVYQEYGIDVYRTENPSLCYSNQEIYLVDEVIKMSRINHSLSQEMLSEGICTPETLSRIESGKRAPNPRNFHALMEKLDVDQDYYNGKLDTDDFLLLEKKRELDRAIALRDWQEARKLLEELKAELDMSSPLNRQMLQIDENAISFGENRISSKEFLKMCEVILDCRGEGWKQDSFWKQFLTNDKIKVLNSIAIVYMEEKQQDKSVFIWEHILMQLEQSKVELSDRYVSSMLVIINLSIGYGELEYFEECLNMCEKGIQLCFEAGRGVRIAKLLCTKAETLFKLGNKETCQNYLRQAYYLSDLMFTNKTTTYINDFYSSHYVEKQKWY